MRDVVIVSGARTAIGNFGGGLKDVPVVQLGSVAIKAVLQRAGLRPVAGDTMLATCPDKLKGQGLVEPEKKRVCLGRCSGARHHR